MLNSLIGIIASSGAGGVPNSYESIATVTVGSGGSSSISFTSIPSTYQHLQLRGILKTTTSGSALSPMTLTVNSDTTFTNYRNHQLYGDGSTAQSYDTVASSWQGAGVGGVIDVSPTSTFSAFVIDILDYASTSKNKTFRSLYGADANGSGQVGIWSGLYINSSTAITSLTTQFPQGRTLAQYSSFALYGIKG
jgi:hypothetical protein